MGGQPIWSSSTAVADPAVVGEQLDLRHRIGPARRRRGPIADRVPEPHDPVVAEHLTALTDEPVVALHDLVAHGRPLRRAQLADQLGVGEAQAELVVDGGPVGDLQVEDPVQQGRARSRTARAARCRGRGRTSAGVARPP